jgi:hypothetical protein
MRATHFLAEADISTNIMKDPKLAKMLAIAVRHDRTFPKNEIADMGPRPTVADYVQAWSKLVNETLAKNEYGDLSKEGKFDSWLLKLYNNHAIDYEDLNGEGGDALGAWQALSTRGLLKKPDQDLNNKKFTSLRALQKAMERDEYRTTLRRIKDAEELEKHKRTKKEIVLIDNDRFHVIMPLNYGACYTFNNQTGHMSNFCTGGSSGHNWFNNYAPDGPIISIIDKQNIDNKNGKWQLHAPTSQLVNSTQDQRYNRTGADLEFSKRFPGLMKEIVKAILTKASEVKTGSKEISPPDGYDVREAAKQIVAKFPQSYKSTPGAPGKNLPTDDNEFVNQPAEPEPTQATQPTQAIEPEGPRISDWRIYNAGRQVATAINKTQEQAMQELEKYAVKNRIPRGRMYLSDYSNGQIFR